MRFDEPLTALQVVSLPCPTPNPNPDALVEEQDAETSGRARRDSEMYLQATAGKTVYSFGLGQRALSRLERTAMYG